MPGGGGNLIRESLSWIAEGALGAVGVPRPRCLLIMGHMRCGSSLLTHLLLTHPAVASVGERNRAYRRSRDLSWLHLEARLAARRWRRPIGYVVDQVNHDRFTPNPGMLGQARVSLVFMLREPRASIASLLELSRRFYRDSWSEARATDYYVGRLATLARVAEALPDAGHATLVEYESLVDAPESTLDRLRGFLGLEGAFSLTYDAQAFTGLRGDPGPLIRSGRIQRPAGAAGTQLDPGRLAAARDAYSQFGEQLRRRLDRSMDPAR